MEKTPEETLIESRAEDQASIDMLKKALKDGVNTCFERYDTQKNHCGFGIKGVCCKICHMGPCRITKDGMTGVCGLC